MERTSRKRGRPRVLVTDEMIEARGYLSSGATVNSGVEVIFLSPLCLLLVLFNSSGNKYYKKN